MTQIYYASTGKNLALGLGLAFVACVLFVIILLNAEKLSCNVSVASGIVANILAWIGVVYLHKVAFERN